MIMTIEDIEDILWDGTKSQIKELEGSGASYVYTPSGNSFIVKYDRCESRSIKLDPDYLPNCIKVFGNSHTF